MVEVEEVGNKMHAQMRLNPGPEEDADLPLPALFDKASHLHSLASNSSLDQEWIRKGVDVLRRCDEMVSKLALFSSNEIKDDVSTANLKYLLVPYYLGEMIEKVAQEDRIPILKASQDHLKEFISICEALELIPEDELELSRQRQPDTMANRRAQKVRNNVTPMQKKPNFDLSGILVENNSSNWIDNFNGLQKEIGLGGWDDKVAVGNNQFENSNSFLDLEPDTTQLPAFFYQRYKPEQKRCRAESVASQNSDNFDASTSCSSDQEVVLSASGLKAAGIANGGISTKKKPQAKNAKNMAMRSTNPACKSPLSQKRLQTPIRNGRTPNGKINIAK